MLKNLYRVGLTAAVLLGAAASAGAQVRGLPVQNSGVISGLSLSLDAGLPNDAAGGGYAAGATAGLGFGPLGVTARVSRFDPEAAIDALWSAGATANYKVFGGPLIPFAATLQAGAGYSSPEFECLSPGACDIGEWHFPVGIGVSLTVPNPALAIKPWIAPRLNIVRRSVGDASSTETDFGISGGIELNTLTGLGLHATYDLVKHDGGSSGIFGAGLHYNFRLPGL